MAFRFRPRRNACAGQAFIIMITELHFYVNRLYENSILTLLVVNSHLEQAVYSALFVRFHIYLYHLVYKGKSFNL